MADNTTTNRGQFGPGDTRGRDTRFKPGHTLGHRFKAGNTFGTGTRWKKGVKQPTSRNTSAAERAAEPLVVPPPGPPAPPFLEAIEAHFELHGLRVLDEVRTLRAVDYLRLCGTYLAKRGEDRDPEARSDPARGLSDQALERAIARLSAEIAAEDAAAAEPASEAEGAG